MRFYDPLLVIVTHYFSMFVSIKSGLMFVIHTIKGENVGFDLVKQTRQIKGVDLVHQVPTQTP
jgi:hypothetical protein